MKILILGTGKSGTTALVYKVAGGLPHCAAFSGGRPGKYIGDYENAVYKHTYQERKGKSFDLYEEHLQKENYDRLFSLICRRQLILNRGGGRKEQAAEKHQHSDPLAG